MSGGAGDDVITVTMGSGSIFGDRQAIGDYVWQHCKHCDLGSIIGEYSYSYTEDRDYTPSEGHDTINVKLCDYCFVTSEGGDDVVSIGSLRRGDIRLGEGDDTLAIDVMADYGGGNIYGDDGNDNIHIVETQYSAKGGTDTIYGGAGDDTIAVDYAGGPNACVYGGAGDDVLSMGGDTPVRIDGGGGDDTCTFQGSALTDAKCKFADGGGAYSYSYCTPNCDYVAPVYFYCPQYAYEGGGAYCNCRSDCETELCDCDEAWEADCCGGWDGS